MPGTAATAEPRHSCMTTGAPSTVDDDDGDGVLSVLTANDWVQHSIGTFVMHDLRVDRSFELMFHYVRGLLVLISG